MENQENIQLLKVSEVAKMLNLNKMTIYSLIKSDVIKSVKIGRSVRIPKSEVERMSKVGGGE